MFGISVKNGKDEVISSNDVFLGALDRVVEVKAGILVTIYPAPGQSRAMFATSGNGLSGCGFGCKSNKDGSITINNESMMNLSLYIIRC